MELVRVEHIRWVPPEYGELAQTVRGEVLSPDWVGFYLPECPQRCFLWKPWSVILRRHYGFGEPWYEPDLPWRADIVSIAERDDDLRVTDLFVDVLMNEDGTRYKVLDLDELAEAASLGRIRCQLACNNDPLWGVVGVEN